MTLPAPSSFYDELTDQRLGVVAGKLLDVRYATLREMTSPFDDNYTREGTVFGRSRNMLIDLALRGGLDWMELVNPGMDVTLRIGRVPCRFFRDDPDQPEKAGFFKRNAVDDLFALDETQPVMWRFVVERALNEDDEDRVHFIGYNAFQEKVSEWVYQSGGAMLHSVDRSVPPSTPIAPAEVDVREEDGDVADLRARPASNE
jgi:hypothetical protein